MNIIPRNRSLKFENAWLREPICRQIVEESWRKPCNEDLRVKISNCLTNVSAWGQEFTGNFRERIARCKKVIKLTKGSRDVEAIERHQAAKKNLTEILIQKEVFWKQR